MRKTSDAPDIILASSSPRRRALMESAGFSFRVLLPRVMEIPRPGESPGAFARRAAREKAASVHSTLPAPETNALRHILGCDTVVAVGSAILGKPDSVDEAGDMLRRLSGRTHEVLTGLCILTEHAGTLRRRSRLVRTEVRFRSLSETEIIRYVAGKEPMDKAGAYAIQGGAAGMVRWIRGSYTNVVGLPLAELILLLAPSDPTREPS